MKKSTKIKGPRFILTPTEKVVRAYNRQFECGYKVHTLKELCERAGVNYEYARVLNSRLARQHRKNVTHEVTSVTHEVTL